MKIMMQVIASLKTKQANQAIHQATKLAMRDTIVAIHGDSVKNAKAVGFWETGHNARSIASEVSGMGVVKQGEDAAPERVVDDKKIEGAVYSTSGYGGFGETGTVKMAARPYMKPALDKNFTDEKFAEKVKRHLS